MIFVEVLFEKVSCDISGLWLVIYDNNCYILVFIDMCIKWFEVFVILNIEVKIVVEIFVKEIVSCYGVLCVFLLDCGFNFFFSLF